MVGQLRDYLGSPHVPDRRLGCHGSLCTPMTRGLITPGWKRQSLTALCCGGAAIRSLGDGVCNNASTVVTRAYLLLQVENRTHFPPLYRSTVYEAREDRLKWVGFVAAEIVPAEKQARGYCCACQKWPQYGLFVYGHGHRICSACLMAAPTAIWTHFATWCDQIWTHFATWYDQLLTNRKRKEDMHS